MKYHYKQQPLPPLTLHFTIYLKVYSVFTLIIPTKYGRWTRKILESPFSHLGNQDLEIGKIAQWLRDPPVLESQTGISENALNAVISAFAFVFWDRSQGGLELELPLPQLPRPGGTPVLPHLAGFQYSCFTLHSLEKSSKIKVTFSGRVKMDGKGRVNLLTFNFLISVVSPEK